MNVLFLTHRLPYAPNRGDRIRSYYLMREMARFARVSLFSLVHDAEEAGHSGAVPFASSVEVAHAPRLANLARGALRLPTSRPLTHSLLDAPDAKAAIARLVGTARPDVVVAYCSGMARFALEPPLAKLPFVLDMVDVDSEKWRSLGRTAGPPKQWIYRREARTLAAFEIEAAERAQAVLVASAPEGEALRRLAPHARVQVMPNGIDVEAFAPPGAPSASPIVTFAGVMDYEPNVQAVAWFAQHVWPRVRAARPDARFTIIGSRPVEAVQVLATRDPSITVTGQVATVQPHLWGAAVSVAPIAVARGIQNKVLEALAAGLPCVVTSAVAAGLPETALAGCLVADAPEVFGDAVMRLLQEAPNRRRARAAAAGVGRLTWERQFAPVKSIVTAAMANA